MQRGKIFTVASMCQARFVSGIFVVVVVLTC